MIVNQQPSERMKRSKEEKRNERTYRLGSSEEPKDLKKKEKMVVNQQPSERIKTKQRRKRNETNLRFGSSRRAQRSKKKKKRKWLLINNQAKE
jgi:hypothetical protein